MNIAYIAAIFPELMATNAILLVGFFLFGQEPSE